MEGLGFFGLFVKFFRCLSIFEMLIKLFLMPMPHIEVRGGGGVLESEKLSGRRLQGCLEVSAFEVKESCC